MVAQYFFPEVTFAEVARVSRWQPGYVVWEMPFWNWIIERGISVTTYETSDLRAWAEEGIEGLRRTTPKAEFDFFLKYSYDLESYSEDMQQLFTQPNFTQIKEDPTWEDLLHHVREDAVCTVVLNSRALDHEDGFVLHQVAILDATEEYVRFHDPRGSADARPNREESRAHFEQAWLQRTNQPSLTSYIRS